jgi:hypothetical protein
MYIFYGLVPVLNPKQRLAVVDGKLCQHHTGPKDIAVQ